MKDLRKLFGKVYKKGLDLFMEHACAPIPEREAQQLEATELRNKDAPSQSSTYLQILLNKSRRFYQDVH